MDSAYSIRVETEVEDGIEAGTARYLDWKGREVAMFTDNVYDQHDSKQVLEAVNRYWDLLDAVRDLVFIVGQLPAAKTIHDQELNRAYSRASDFLRAEHEQRLQVSEDERHG